MLSENELRYTLALQRVPNLGETSAKKLIAKIGSAEGIFKEKKNHLIKIDGIGAFRLDGIDASLQLKEADAELQFINQNEIEYDYFKDPSYPDRLKHCIDAPLLLFRRGNIDLKNKKIISVVGTRKVTFSGREFCEELISELSPLNPVIISGYAYGVDITAHKTAMDQNLQTVACLAHGLNQIYPKSHHRYMKDIESNGGFFTDFWSCDAFDRTNFLKRNRIIAGISEATIVIESAEKGGSLVTADIANSYNRDVFAVPGKPGDLQSKGCNNLIKSQQAHLLTSAADLIYILGWDLQDSQPKTTQTQLFVELNSEEKKIVAYFQKIKKDSLDEIALNCEIPIYKLVSLLFDLEMKGVVRPLPGKLFELR